MPWILFVARFTTQQVSSPVGMEPQPSARVHRREVDEFQRELRTQQENIEELTAALTAESEVALANHPFTVNSPGSIASPPLDDTEAVIEALQNREEERFESYQKRSKRRDWRRLLPGKTVEN